MILQFYHLYILSLLLILTNQINHIHGTVVQTPAFACVGDVEARVNCALTPPNTGDVFTESFVNFTVGDSDNSISPVTVNGNSIVNGVNLSRVIALAPTGNTTFISGSLILVPFNSSDNNLRLGCTVQYAVNGSMSNLMVLNESLRIRQAVPPSAPSLQSYVSNFNTATCSANISLSWNTPLSNRTVDRYFLYFNGSLLASLTSTNYTHSTVLNINTPILYAIRAMSCAGNSTTATHSIGPVGYMLTMSSCWVSDNVDGRLTVNWDLAPIQPSGVSGLSITYYLQLSYSQSRENVTFTLPSSSELSHNTVLTANNETNITVSLMIIQQCRQSFNRAALECPFIPSTSMSPTSTSESTPTSTSESTPTSTSESTPTSTSESTPAELPIAIIGGAIGGALGLLVILSIIFCITILCCCILKKRRTETHTKDQKQPDGENVEMSEQKYDYVFVNSESNKITTQTSQDPYYTHMAAQPTNEHTESSLTATQENPYYSQVTNRPDRPAELSASQEEYYTKMKLQSGNQSADLGPNTREETYYTPMNSLSRNQLNPNQSNTRTMPK